VSFLNSSSSSSATNPEDLDGDGIIDAHEQAYSKGNAGNLNSNQMGSAAAMNAFKQFTQGGGSTQGSTQGGDFKSQLIGRGESIDSRILCGCVNGG